mgnify:CR=1 FL=1
MCRFYAAVRHGASADTAGCVVSDEEVAAAEAGNAAGKAANEYGEMNIFQVWRSSLRMNLPNTAARQ